GEEEALAQVLEHVVDEAAPVAEARKVRGLAQVAPVELGDRARVAAGAGAGEGEAGAVRERAGAAPLGDPELEGVAVELDGRPGAPPLLVGGRDRCEIHDSIVIEKTAHLSAGGSVYGLKGETP